MSQTPPDQSRERSQLEATLMRELGLENPQARAASLKLQPVVLPPPPTEVIAPPAYEPPQEPLSDLPSGASSADDLDPVSEDQSQKGKGKLLALIALVLMAAGGVGWFVMGLGKPSFEAKVPIIEAPKPADIKAAEPSERTATPLPGHGIGEVPTELTPPSTDGLSPARKVSAIRILVENDREVRR